MQMQPQRGVCVPALCFFGAGTSSNTSKELDRFVSSSQAQAQTQASKTTIATIALPTEMLQIQSKLGKRVWQNESILEPYLKSWWEIDTQLPKNQRIAQNILQTLNLLLNHNSNGSQGSQGSQSNKSQELLAALKLYLQKFVLEGTTVLVLQETNPQLICQLFKLILLNLQPEWMFVLDFLSSHCDIRQVCVDAQESNQLKTINDLLMHLLNSIYSICDSIKQLIFDRTTTVVTTSTSRNLARTHGKELGEMWAIVSSCVYAIHRLIMRIPEPLFNQWFQSNHRRWNRLFFHHLLPSALAEVEFSNNQQQQRITAPWISHDVFHVCLESIELLLVHLEFVLANIPFGVGTTLGVEYPQTGQTGQTANTENAESPFSLWNLFAELSKVLSQSTHQRDTQRDTQQQQQIQSMRIHNLQVILLLTQHRQGRPPGQPQGPLPNLSFMLNSSTQQVIVTGITELARQLAFTGVELLEEQLKQQLIIYQALELLIHDNLSPTGLLFWQQPSCTMILQFLSEHLSNVSMHVQQGSLPAVSMYWYDQIKASAWQIFVQFYRPDTCGPLDQSGCDWSGLLQLEQFRCYVYSYYNRLANDHEEPPQEEFSGLGIKLFQSALFSSLIPFVVPLITYDTIKQDLVRRPITYSTFCASEMNEMSQNQNKTNGLNSLEHERSEFIRNVLKWAELNACFLTGQSVESSIASFLSQRGLIECYMNLQDDTNRDTKGAFQRFFNLPAILIQFTVLNGCIPYITDKTSMGLLPLYNYILTLYCGNTNNISSNAQEWLGTLMKTALTASIVEILTNLNAQELKTARHGLAQGLEHGLHDIASSEHLGLNLLMNWCAFQFGHQQVILVNVWHFVQTHLFELYSLIQLCTRLEINSSTLKKKDPT